MLKKKAYAKALSSTVKKLYPMVRFTAFVDVLGWRSLTYRQDTELLSKYADALFQRTTPAFTGTEIRSLDESAKKFWTAADLDATISIILDELQYYFKPIPTSCAKQTPEFVKSYYNHQHVTFVRASDSIFLLSTDLSRLLRVVSEIFKRAMIKGLLLRAGISVGPVQHSTITAGPALDPECINISIFGGGITTAVETEKQSGGMRVYIHPDIFNLVEGSADYAPHILTRKSWFRRKTHELRWWKDFWQVGMNDTEAMLLTEWTKQDIEKQTGRLYTDHKFEWNRRSKDGRKKLRDTKSALQVAANDLADRKRR